MLFLTGRTAPFDDIQTLDFDDRSDGFIETNVLSVFCPAHREKYITVGHQFSNPTGSEALDDHRGGRY